MFTGLLLGNMFVGFLLRRVVGAWLDRKYKPITSRLISYWTGLAIDIGLSWLVLREGWRLSSDRRKFPLSFEQYAFYRLISALPYWFGVVLGYLTDYEEQ
jgi:hypothetical protein